MDSATSPDEITRLLHRIRAGDPEATDRLFSVLYGELQRLARGQRGRWSGDYTLNTTALVHEAYLKLVDGKNVGWRDRAHFLSVSARAMRHILLNYAERQQAAKRGGHVTRLPLDSIEPFQGANPVSEEAAEEIIALHQALERLEQVSGRQARVVECRFFAGLPIRETAEVLGVSPATVKRDWTLASAWLFREINLSLEIA